MHYIHALAFHYKALTTPRPLNQEKSGYSGYITIIYTMVLV